MLLSDITIHLVTVSEEEEMLHMTVFGTISVVLSELFLISRRLYRGSLRSKHVRT